MYFTASIFQLENTLLRDILAGPEQGLPRKLLFFIDAGVARCHPRLAEAIGAYCRFHGASLTLCGPPLMVTGGEEVKNDPAYVADAQQAIHEAGLCRHSYVVALGGGAVLDMVGYAAATVHRGVRLIRIPTTVLAQGDAGLGVKNGINAFGKKNYLGTFAPPWAVLNDSSFLASLSDRDWRSGLAEALKVALIKDAPLFAFIEGQAAALRRRDRAAMEQVIHRSATLHLEHLARSGDPFEAGSSRPLDFGHWSAHKLEQLSGYELRHGEAVAVGMAIDATYSRLAGWLSARQWERIIDLLLGLGFRLDLPELANAGDLLKGLKEFREHLGGELTIMLLAGIGQGREVHALEEEGLRRAISQVRELKGGARL